MNRVALVVLLFASAGHAQPTPVPISGDGGLFLEAALGISILSETVGSPSLVGALAPGVRSGLRGTHWGVFGVVEAALWWAPTGVEDETEVQSALNVGVGGEVLYGAGYVRTSLALGPSILLKGSELDTGGDVGFFLEFRAAGLRWDLDGPYVLVADPLSFSLIMPALDGIPLVEVEYRSGVAVEYLF